MLWLGAFAGICQPEMIEFEVHGQVRIFNEGVASKAVFDGRPNEARMLLISNATPVECKNFSVSVRGGSWLVASTNSATGTFARISSCEAGFGIMNVAIMRQRNASSQPEKPPFTPVEIENEGYPSKAERINQLLWFTFASQYYVNPAAPDLPPPLWELHASEDERPFRAHWSRAMNSFGLPAAATFFCDGFKPGQSLNKLTGIKWRKPYDQGFVHYTYEVTSSINLNDQTVPLQSLFTEWTPHNSPKLPNGLRPLFVYEILVSSATPHCPVNNWKPALSVDNRVIDYRISHATSQLARVSYSSKGTNWKSSAEATRIYNESQRLKNLAPLAGSSQAAGNAPVTASSALPVTVPPRLQVIWQTATGGVRFICDNVGRNSTLLGSSDLTNWVAVTNISGALLPATTTDPLSSALPFRFYRLRLD